MVVVRANVRGRDLVGFVDEAKAAVARELDLTPSALSQWVKYAQAERTKGKSGLMKEEREELTRLRKENRELRLERDLLKKSIAFFIRDSDHRNK